MHIRTTKSRKHRPVTGLILIALAVFVAGSRDFGFIGRGLHHVLAAAVGRNGIDLLTLALCLCGTVCVLPPGTLVRGIVWACHALVTGLVFIVEALTPEPQVTATRKLPSKVLQFPSAATLLTPAQRMQLDDVRGALKQFGYRTAEFEHIVVAMDPTQPIEVLVKSALVQLRKAVVS